MAHFFRTPDRRQRFLLPVDMMEWLPQDDIIHLIVDAVGLMDLSKFEATCKVGGAGQPPFAPAMLLTVLIYAYSHGVRSSRTIERLCRHDAGYRFIVGQEVPDHTVIARFRRRHVEQMKGVFRAVPPDGITSGDFRVPLPSRPSWRAIQQQPHEVSERLYKTPDISCKEVQLGKAM